MSGYWEDAERTSEAIDSAGLMHTRDLATMDEDGYIRIVGRIKDMIIPGGENVYAREIESSCTAIMPSPTSKLSACQTSAMARRSWPG
jgi:acyl-CoA synthetase (AMP-forming)/AMP-acid ligase II